MSDNTKFVSDNTKFVSDDKKFTFRVNTTFALFARLGHRRLDGRLHSLHLRGPDRVHRRQLPVAEAEAGEAAEGQEGGLRSEVGKL
jgi:hypothetical protein